MNTVTPTFDRAELRQFYGRMPSGVLALAALIDGQPIGMAVSSFTNVSLDPPLVVVSIRNESSTWPLLSTAPAIGASILAEAQQQHGLQLSTGDAVDRFDAIPYSATESGAIVVHDAVAWFESVPRDVFPAGDHSLVLLELRRIVNDADRAPLVYFRSRFAGVRDV